MAQTAHGPKDGLEVELKFELSQRDVRALWRAPAFKAMVKAQPTRQTLRATYFDTPDLKLSKRGMSLRVRQESRRYVQCVKAGAEGSTVGGFARREWEWPVANHTLDPALIRGEDALKPLFKGINLKKLVPIFSTDIRRQSRVLVIPGGARVQCDVDQGRILCADREAPIIELELELLSGDPAELLTLARMLTGIVPARLSSRSKAHRGFTLYLDQGQPWLRAEALVLSKSPSAEDVLCASMEEGLRHLIGNEDCVLTRGDSEGIHQMRVALRRMRALLTTVKKLLPRGVHEDLASDLKDAASALGPARDWDVFVDALLPPVAAAFNGTPEQAALATLRTHADQRRRDGYQQADRMIASMAYARLLTDALYWVGNRVWRSDGAGPLDAPATTVAAQVLARRHAHLQKAAKGLANLSTEQRHRLRIAVKKTRYAAAFFQPLYAPKKTHGYIQALRALQDHLGHLNDLTNAQRMMAELVQSACGVQCKTLSHAAGLVEGWYAHAQSTREAELLAAWKTFTRAKAFW